LSISLMYPPYSDVASTQIRRLSLSKTWSRNHAATSIATEGRLILDPARHFFASALTLFNSELCDLLSHPQRAAQYARVRAVPTNNAMDLPTRRTPPCSLKSPNACVGSGDHWWPASHRDEPNSGAAKRATVRNAELGESQRISYADIERTGRIARRHATRP